MDDTVADIAMLFVLSGQPLLAESTLDVSKADILMADFKPISSYDDYSNFFEVSSFNFTMTVPPDEGGVGTSNKVTAGGAHAGGGANAAGGGAGSGLFNRWRSATADEARKIRFPLSFDSFSFSRTIDGASPIFFDACVNQRKFDSAALVKRVATGSMGGTARESIAFMRLDFTEVTMMSVSWEDGDLVTETCTFTCRKLRYRYRQQNDDGSLQPITDEANWDRDRDSKVNVGGG